MPVSLPPIRVVEEFLGATTRHTRRVEIYEQDGVTRWAKDTIVRLKDGGVSVDYTRDERRGLDLTLTNDDGGIINQPGEFWYDKILKVFRGVRVNQAARIPKVLVISDKTGTATMAETFRDTLVQLGYGDVRINPLAASYDVDIKPYDIIVGLGNATSAQVTLLQQAYLDGKSVLTMDVDAAAWIAAAFPTSTSSTVGPTLTGPLTTSTHVVSKGWSAFTPGQTGNTTVWTVPSTQWTMIAPDNANPTRARVAAYEEPTRSGRAVTFSFLMNYQQYNDTNFVNLLHSSIAWLNTNKPLNEWETQIGEFMIDRISEPHFPHEIKITGRDYTKKCMLSKYSEATQFAAGQALETLIAAIAGAAGITKRVLPATGVVVARAFFFERGVSRWDAMKEICTAYNYEIFFDATGYLVIRPFRDPATSVPVIYIQTGTEGQVASYEKSTSDAQIYNHVIVTGESSDAATPPVWAEVKNTNPDSPTSIDELGDRYWEYSSAFVTTTDQAMQLAEGYLGVHALEEFELNFETLMLPWLEVGDVIGWIDPNPDDNDPTTFLLTSLNLPLKLGPMSGSARRITIVNTLFKRITSGLTWNQIPTDVTWNNLSSATTWNNA